MRGLHGFRRWFSERAIAVFMTFDRSFVEWQSTVVLFFSMILWQPTLRTADNTVGFSWGPGRVLLGGRVLPARGVADAQSRFDHCWINSDVGVASWHGHPDGMGSIVES
jgi:hypothetical protein